MRHDLKMAVPGVNKGDPGPALGPALARLLAAIDDSGAAPRSRPTPCSASSRATPTTATTRCTSPITSDLRARGEPFTP